MPLQVFLCDLCFRGFVPERCISQVQCCTGCATKQVYYVRKATDMELVMLCKCQNVFGMFMEEQGVCQINVTHCIAIRTLLQIYFISLFCPSLFAPITSFPTTPCTTSPLLQNLFFCRFMVMSLTNLAVSVTQAFTHLAISMQFSFQALILLYEVMELMRFYPVPPHTTSASLLASPANLHTTFSCKSVRIQPCFPCLAHPWEPF